MSRLYAGSLVQGRIKAASVAIPPGKTLATVTIELTNPAGLTASNPPNIIDCLGQTSIYDPGSHWSDVNSQRWVSNAQGNPPDFVFNVGGNRRFAVELDLPQLLSLAVYVTFS